MRNIGENLRAKVHKKLQNLYKIPQAHAKGGSEPEIKSKWVQKSINPEKKGALHKSLDVPSGKKIPLSKLHKAEQSKSPTLRRRAQWAETVRGFHHKPQGR